MIINIFTDPHLGTRRAAHTSPESSKRLTQRLFEAAMAAKADDHTNVIAGDLFDKTTNPESVIVQGLLVAEDAIVLSGNHDETNREGSVSSLEVLEESGVSDIIRSPSVDAAHFAVRDSMVFVPHHASQELFLKALDRVMQGDISGTVLFVHCNRGEMPQQDNSTLVISLELEDHLLTKFKRIFYGHVHGSDSNKVEGDKVISRAVVLGNTHPTSFGDVSNKYRYTYNTVTDSLTRHLIWNKDEKFATLRLGQDFLLGDFEFIEVTGHGARHEISDYIQEAWKQYPNAFAIRNNCTYQEAESAEVKDVDLDDLPAAIERDLEGTDMFELYKQIRSSL